MDTNGSNFTSTWELVGDTLKIWFGDKGSNTFFAGTFSEDGNSYTAQWQWPGGGYEVTKYSVSQVTTEFVKIMGKG